MRKLIYTVIISVSLIVFLISPQTVTSNWVKEEINSAPNTRYSAVSENTINTQQSKSDTLPEGVTQDWLNRLTDENGNRIIPENSSETSREIPEDPEGDAIQRNIFEAPDINSYFGYSVSSAGDVNGDGYDDIIIGALYYNSSTGRAYIYYGGLSPDNIADITMTGDSIGSKFGKSVSTAGDVNGDGYDDVIVGANGDAMNTIIGRAFLYYGGNSMDNIADLTMTGDSLRINFGSSVSTAGDVNGDGYDDVIVGSPWNPTSNGKAYIYYGGNSMDNTTDVIMTGEIDGVRFGVSVSTAGDVNGDGYDDVIVGDDAGSTLTGNAYIYFGGEFMDNYADVIMTGESLWNKFGYSVSSAGDVNGDGYSDVVIGANEYLDYTGRAYIYFGGEFMDDIADVIMTGEEMGNYFGYSVSTAGDVNGDGFSDVIIVAPFEYLHKGRAHIYFGGVTMNNIADVTMTNEIESTLFGISVSSAGDFNGDGYSDVIVGAINRVYLFDYVMKNEIIPDMIIKGVAGEGNPEQSVSFAGDVNGDGCSDLIVGFKTSIGKAYIYFGGSAMDNIADVTMTGETAGDLFGSSVSYAGDVNGDGYDDVIVGATGFSSSKGRAYIFHGGASMNNVADLIMTGETADDLFGRSVSFAGDVNGDGYSDVIVGASGYLNYTGKSYIFYGGAFMNNFVDVTMTGEAVDNFFGRSVSYTSDVNGDGYSDVIVGADGYSTSTGRAYIYFGSAAMNNITDVTLTGESTGNRFGYSVSAAGDVNGDGRSDVIVGAWGYSTSTGRAYIYYGGASMDNIADVTMTGEATSNNFGRSVASAGDVNGDGYSDVITGASNYLNYGRAYIYFGGSPMNNVADVTMTGDSDFDSFGRTVSSGDDLNCDGYSDVVVSGREFSTTTDEVYVFYGSAISVNPAVRYVRDVPDDHGGFLSINWARSSFDNIDINIITDYLVERSLPPSNNNFSWESIATIPATHQSFYSYIAAAPLDTSQNNNGTYFFRITARTSQQSQYWRSGIHFGTSIDNIAPMIVTPFTASYLGPNISLNWMRSSAPDLQDYVLFRSYSNYIDPYTETPLAVTTDSTYLDTNPLPGIFYYIIYARDINGNYSEPSIAPSPFGSVTVNLTMFIEGFYNAALNTQVSDTVTVFLRNSISPYNIEDQTTAVVGSDGTVQLEYWLVTTGDFYIAVTHRNSIETWSSSPVSVFSGGTFDYDFTSSSSQAFGNNMIQIDASPVKFGFYSGDVNQDGTIDLSDGSLIDNDATNFVSGYVSTDVNGDEIVDVADAVFADNNGFNFVSKITP